MDEKRCGVDAGRVGVLSSLGSVSAAVVHEVNNLAQVMLAKVEGMEASAEGATLASIREVKELVLRLGGINRDLLLLSRGRVMPLAPHDVNALILSWNGVFGVLSSTSGVTVKPEIPDPPLFARCNASLLQQALVNLVKNSVEAIASSGTGSSVCIRTYAGEGAACIQVSDDGPGIPRAYADRIFTPFFSTKPAQSGTGIGLAITRALAEVMGGSIAFSDAPERGAVFTVTLPACERQGHSP